MRLIILYIFSCCVCFCILNTGTAQHLVNTQYRAVEWKPENGFPSGRINSIIKDANGFLWFGGGKDALCRFDGSTFKKYVPDPIKPGTIKSVAIRSFFEDDLNNIWISTDSGLSRYDLRADTFTNFAPFIGASAKISVMAAFRGKGDEIFVKEPGLIITAINTRTLARRLLVRLRKDFQPSVAWNSSRSFYDHKSNSIWMFNQGHPLGISQIFSNGIDSLYVVPCFSGKNNHRHHSENMMHDSARNSIWINSGEGLLEFSMTDKIFRRAKPWVEMAAKENYEYGVGLDIDKKGRIWAATKPDGIFIYDPKSDETRKLFPDDLHLQLLVAKNNMQIYHDPDGISWTSSWSESELYEILPVEPIVTRFAANSFQKDSLSSGFITTILNGPDGKLWIGTADGLNIFDPVNETFQVLREKELPGINGKAIIPVFTDTIRKKAWLKASWNNIFKHDIYFRMPMYEMDIRTGECTKVTFKSGKKVFDSVYTSFETVPSDKGFLIADDDLGVFEVNAETQTAELIIPFDPGPSGIGGMAMIRDRYLFVQHGGTLPNYSFEKNNGKWIKTNHILDSTNWSVMRYSPMDSTIWVASRTALLHYDNDFNLIHSLEEKSGYHGMVLSLQIDNQGILWMVNELNQVTRMDPREARITSITEMDGYQEMDYFWFVPGQKDKYGNIYFGSGWLIDAPKPGWGLDKIVPLRYNASSPVRVYINSITVNQKASKAMFNPSGFEELKLDHDQNTIRIESGIIDFHSKNKNKLRYRIEANGQMGDWFYPADPIIRLEKLSPGSYRLLIQASDGRGSFSGPMKELRINISTPFWQTWWFRILALLLAGTIFYLIVRYRTQQIFSQRLERSQKEKRIAELQQQKSEIEMQALRAQMNPHFIFNSLNSINRFILQNDKAQASEYLTKFSRLVRLILQNSQSSMISLESELDSLRLYLDLEAVRFEHRFAYAITVPNDMDIEMLKVPPLIIQPYTENAIWHGLMHKEEKGQLDIEVGEENDHLVIRITDNGIGREAARAIAGKTSTKHKSFGMKITANRIAMLEKSMDGVSPVTIEDLVNPDGTAAGTSVTIRVPAIA